LHDPRPPGHTLSVTSALMPVSVRACRIQTVVHAATNLPLALIAGGLPDGACAGVERPERGARTHAPLPRSPSWPLGPRNWWSWGLCVRLQGRVHHACGRARAHRCTFFAAHTHPASNEQQLNPMHARMRTRLRDVRAHRCTYYICHSAPPLTDEQQQHLTHATTHARTHGRVPEPLQLVGEGHDGRARALGYRCRRYRCCCCCCRRSCRRCCRCSRCCCCCCCCCS